MCVNDCKWARSHSTLHIHADICMTSLTVFRTPVQLLLPSCMETFYLCGASRTLERCCKAGIYKQRMVERSASQKLTFNAKIIIWAVSHLRMTAMCLASCVQYVEMTVENRKNDFWKWFTVHMTGKVWYSYLCGHFCSLLLYTCYCIHVMYIPIYPVPFPPFQLPITGT